MTSRSLILAAVFVTAMPVFVADRFAAMAQNSPAAATTPPATAPPSLTPGGQPGHWEGVIEIPGQPLAFDLDFVIAPDGSITGDITIPLQSAKDLPLEKISVTGNQAAATIKGVPGDPTFKGEIAADGASVKGRFTQGGGSFPFTWTRVKDPGKASADALAGFVEWADTARKDWRAPGLAIAIIKDGRVVLSKGLGTKDIDSEDAVTPDTLFAIGSCTKAFTTFTLGTLVDEGKVSWDKPVREYMPEFKLRDAFASEHLTLRDMVTHRSGLPRHDLSWYNSPLSRKDLVARVAYLEPNKELREAWQYNNFMFLTAGYLVERVTGGTWEEAVKARVFEPLSMGNSNFSVVESQKSADFAHPCEWRDEKMRRVPFRDISQIGPAGSINSSIRDMARWAMVHLSKGEVGGVRVISENTIADLHQPQMLMPGTSEDPEIINIGYAMGWMVSAYRGHVMVEHGGNTDGFTALVTLLPKDNIAVVALTNMSGSALPTLATYHALDRLLGGEKKEWSAIALRKYRVAEKMGKEGKAAKGSVRKQGTAPSHSLAEYAGDYENPGYGIAAVKLDGAKLELSYNNISAPMEHWHYDTFACGKNEADPALEDVRILFRTSLAGDIDGFEVALDPTVKPIVFQKKASSRMSDVAYLAKFVGAYELGPQVVSVSLRGAVLVATVPGQPPYDLLPVKDDTFSLKGLTGFSLRFTTDEGKVVDAKFIQPDGVYTAKRK